MAQATAIAGLVTTAFGQMSSGDAAKDSAYMEAEQLDRLARARRAEAQLAAREERRQARLERSRARALAAASGGGMADPTVVNLMGDLEAEGEYRAMSRLYEGESEAQGHEFQARIRRKEGKAAKRASTLRTVSSVLTGAADLKTRYG